MTAIIDNKPWVSSYPEWFTPIFPGVGESILAKFRRIAATCSEDQCI